MHCLVHVQQSRFSKGIPRMRTLPTVLALCAIGLAILLYTRASGDPDWPADFVLRVHDDSSVDWSLVIPPTTWKAMESEVNEGNARIAGSVGMGDEVLKLVGIGFGKRGFSADRCQVIGKSHGIDGSMKYDGQCLWTDAPRRQRI
jgi:hypothetical protein